MSYQFGTNWSGFSGKAGNVIGPLLAYEVLTAFFLEAGFLGVMLFGWKRVPTGCTSSPPAWSRSAPLISAFWILAANSWMQTPAGLRDRRRRPLRAGRLVAGDLQPVVPLPPRPHGARRLSHDGVRRRPASAPGICCASRETSPHGRTMLGMALCLLVCRAAADRGRRPARPEHAASTSRRRSPRSKAHWETGAAACR